MILPDAVNYLLWRPVHHGMGTLAEVSERWTLDDVLDAHDILDAFEDAERKQMKAEARRHGR